MVGGFMTQTTIELINDYFIEVDELNHTLKKDTWERAKKGKKNKQKR